MKHLLITFALLLISVPPMAQGEEPPPPCCSVGDVNGSGGITTFDVLEIRKHLFGVAILDEEGLCNADVDGDGLVTELDIDLVAALVVGAIQSVPRCGDLDGNGQLDWAGGGGDLNFFTGCAFGPGGQGCGNADANDNGALAFDDITIFTSHANGSIQSFPGCACGEGACAGPQ